MRRITDEKSWKQLMQEDKKLMQLAINAGVENNFKRISELNGCFSLNCGDDVVNSDAERELAMYLFCMTDNDALNSAYRTRHQVAHKAGIGDL